MPFLYFLPKNNKFTPSFEPATITSNYSTYIDITTGVPTGTVYAFYGTQYTTPANPNWVDYFNVLPKGNCELGAMHASLENGGSTYFSTPNGHYLRFWRNDYYVAGVLQEWIEVFCDDGNGGEYGILAQRVENFAIGWRYWMSIQVDLDAGKAVPTTLVLISPDSVTGNASITISGGGVETNVTKAKALFDVVDDALMAPDPYLPAGTSETGGGAGSFDDVSDAVTMPGLPALNLSINGFVTAYAPTLTQINNLATFVWSDWLSGGPTLPKIFASPEDAVISLHMLPFTPSTGTAVEVTVGNYASDVYMDPMTEQFYTINCGSLDIEEYWGNYLDYNPYTKLTLFLPYVGEITLNPDEVMTQTITIKYRVDAMTGAFVAFVLRDDDKIIGEYQGNCSLQVPISSANYAQLHSALLGLAGSAVSMAVGAAGSGISGLLSGGSGVLTSAAGMMDSKIRHSHSGALGSASGFMGSQSPYLIIERARQCLPSSLNTFAGYPSQITARLGDLHGFTSVSEIILDGIRLTDEELAELREILKGGVYL